MSINSAMQSGVTALAANSTALATISNNIANSNTTGFKRILTNFTDLVSGTSAKSSYASGGVVAVNRQTVTNQGELNNNTLGYSLGIEGQGFFVVSDQPTDVTSATALLFTRDGSFTPDTSGNLVNAGGFYLEGWPADSSGNINISATDANMLAPINVTAITNKAEATTALNFVANVDPATTQKDATKVIAPATAMTYDPASTTTAMSVYDASTGTGTRPDSTISATISDSLGQQHTVTISLLKGNVSTTAPTSGETEWYYEISGSDIDDGAGLHQLGKGSVFFDPDGKLDLTNSTGQLKTGVTLAGADATGTPAAPAWNVATGAKGQDLTFGFGAAGTSALSQTKGDSTTVSVKANGTEFGSLSKVEIGKDGIVTAIYSNGNTRTLAQVAMATFLNANGLTPVTGNAYAVSTDSGAYLLKQPGQGGAGTLNPDTLEASTVDLAQEFTGLITTQRAYSAASKIVTTADEMLQELLAIKR
ncbi:MAG: flagellar hook-basal body complex protein [Asticcacaulis sp.]